MTARKLLLNPFTVLLAAVGLFHGLRSEMGYPHGNLHALLFIFTLGYGCVCAYMLVFYTSDWVPALRKMKFPAAYRNPVFMAGMGLATLVPKTLIASAVALYAFDASPSLVTRIATTLLAVAACAATMPIMRSPPATTAP